MDGIGNFSATDYTSYITQANSDKLTSSLSGANKDKATDAEMLEACKEFETYMVEQVYKQMEKTIMKADDEENEYEQYFGDYRIHEMAKQVSDQSNLGLANQLYQAMKRNSGVD